MAQTPAGPRPELQTLAFDSFDPESMAGALQKGELEHVQLAKGRFTGSIQRTQCDAARIDWGRYNLPVLAAGALAEDCVSLGFIISSSSKGTVNGEPVGASDVIVMPERSELYFRLAAGTEWISFQVARSVLERLGLNITQRQTGVVRISAVERAVLRGAVAEIGQVIGPDRNPDRRPSSEAIAAAKEDLLAAFARALAAQDDDEAHRPRPSAAERLRVVQRVESYLESHLGEPLRVDELCTAVGANLHTLERAFTDVHGVSPKKFLTLRRLASARKDLMRGSADGASVTDVAMNWGFFHLSRFSADYKALFQESPSETLAVGRGIASAGRQVD